VRQMEYETMGFELAQLELHSDGDGRTMVGYASAFDVPMMGDAGETVVMDPRVWDKTLKERAGQIQVLYHHGRDPQIGTKPLGVPSVLRTDRKGLWTETPLAHTSYNDEIVIPLLASGALRAMSVGFGVIAQSWDDKGNERRVTEAILGEFGPTPFPRNLGATAALHSMDLIEFLEEHWDGAAAMRACSTAADFRQIAFERSNDSDPDTAAHWTLPHHQRPGAGADSAGVAAALGALSGARGGAPDLKQSVETVRAHLQAHQAESSSDDDRGTDEAAASSIGDRLTRRMDEHAADLAEQEARWQALGS